VALLQDVQFGAFPAERFPGGTFEAVKVPTAADFLPAQLVCVQLERLSFRDDPRIVSLREINSGSQLFIIEVQ
jgi:hypothetical protein